MRFFCDCRGEFQGNGHFRQRQNDWNERLCGYHMAGEALIAGSFARRCFRLVMIAIGHHCHPFGIHVHFHGCSVRVAGRHGDGGQPVQRQAHQHGEQHEQANERTTMHDGIMRADF